MYQAKRKGGAGHQIIDLREALAGQRPQQPRAGPARRVRRATSSTSPTSRSCAARDGLVTGVEALLRWTAPAARPGPARCRWSTIAEQSGLISEIGAWVLERSCRDHAAWLRRAPRHAARPRGQRLGPPADEPRLLRHRRARCSTETGMDPAALVLEMTENIFIEDSERAMTVLADLNDARGPARPRRLRHRLLVAELPAPAAGRTSSRSTRASSPTSASARPAGAIVAAVTNLAHVLGLTVTAEGVETAEPARRGQRDRAASRRRATSSPARCRAAQVDRPAGGADNRPVVPALTASRFSAGGGVRAPVSGS